MLGTVDALKRPLKIPPKFVPYLEKHKIYELFQELAIELIKKQPYDHIAYLKESLNLIAKSRTCPRIILLSPPNFHKTAFLKHFCNKLEVQPITYKDVATTIHFFEEKNFAKCVDHIVSSDVVRETGWILHDLPRSKEEAIEFQRIGIMPTHVIDITVSRHTDSEQCAETVACFHAPMRSYISQDKNPKYLEYQAHVSALRELYSDVLIQVETGGRKVHDFAQDCVTLIKTFRKHPQAPSLLRVALIGSRGSGCRTVAKLIAERFNLVHVDFTYIIHQVEKQDNPIGNALRMIGFSGCDCDNPNILIQVVQKYILGEECLRKGWILTGYPRNLDECKLLNNLSTPPNRVIFIDLNACICAERLLARRRNVITGSSHNFSCQESYNVDDFAVHPNDYRNIVERNVIKDYKENVKCMKKYFGNQASYVCGNDDIQNIRERIETLLISAAPYHVPDPKAPEVFEENCKSSKTKTKRNEK